MPIPNDVPRTRKFLEICFKHTIPIIISSKQNLKIYFRIKSQIPRILR